MENTTLFFEIKGLKDGDLFPVDYTGRGKNYSPEFTIKNLSPQAKTIAIFLEDFYSFGWLLDRKEF